MTSPGALDTATAVVQRAQELAQTRWDEVDGPEAVAVAETVAAAKGLLDAALLRTAERITDTNAVAELGWASVKDFLTHVLGGHHGTGGGLVRAAAQLRELPQLQAALEDGRLTLPQARAIAGQVHTLPRVPEFRTAVADRMLELATHDALNASALQGAFAEVVRELDPAAAILDTEKQRSKDERGAHHQRQLTITDDGRGGVRFRGYGSSEDGEHLKATLLPLSAPVTTEPGACGGHASDPHGPLFDADGKRTQVPCPTPGCAHDGSDPRDAGARLWDALVDACIRLRNADELPRDHGSAVKVVVTTDHDSLRQQVIDAGLAREGRTDTGTRLSATAVRRLACDAHILPAVLGTDGQVLDVGRAHRLVTPAIWAALVLRDRHCAFPGCTRMPLACDAHHVVHWADGGDTSLDNLVLLCRHHHTLTHHSPWQVHIDPHTRQPVWTGPPRLTLKHLEGRMIYHDGRPRGAPLVA
ncbi:hypothetical protein CFH99_15100 [Nocardioides aromaticivorans]|uniref:HNH nuclease domain-containing protein n=1 Tax=Nocardioides aromaticivorans TaxID=200618 RepID=A0ABX7PM88_9ACTN|nr:HNH endonuclease signature motif containing protein [Nocardioides aromaticivorans]QSR26956.1 hypothetical protein CFH99_15100 [Nocardioides aromaticivorans]